MIPGLITITKRKYLLNGETEVKLRKMAGTSTLICLIVPSSMSQSLFSEGHAEGLSLPSLSGDAFATSTPTFVATDLDWSKYRLKLSIDYILNSSETTFIDSKPNR